MKFATLFSGGELFGVGARQAGLEHSFGIELNPKIAEVAHLNGFQEIITGDIRTVTLPHRDLFLLHASPPCQNASGANSYNCETTQDIEIAIATSQAVSSLMPTFFTLENVINYKNFKSFSLITNELKRIGYSFEKWDLNFADYGVPQTRRRLILMARRGEYRLPKPFPTHQKKSDLFTESWIGWYDAASAAGIIDTLEDAEFSDYQIKNLTEHGFNPLSPPSRASQGFLADVRQFKRRGAIRLIHEPSFTIVATQWKGHCKGRLPSGKIFKANQRLYSTLQTIPAEYQFGKSNTINQSIIGNGVPCLFAKALVRHLLKISK